MAAPVWHDPQEKHPGTNVDVFEDRPDLYELLTMLTYTRAHGSDGERMFIERFILPEAGSFADGWAFKAVVPRPDGSDSRTLFSCHTDTVHAQGLTPKQKIDYDQNLDLVCAVGQPLGADDGAGCWLMLHMIRANVPGTYVFHRCEERGGQGSDYIARNMSGWLEDNFDRAIAFDRKGTSDVITHQGFSRCCSEDFAKALADSLCELGLDYAPSDAGVFTDTANYTDAIAECTNLSCGYESEHTANEMLDVEHLFKMRDALVKLDWDALPTKRKPGDDDFDYKWDHDRWWQNSLRHGSWSSDETPVGMPRGISVEELHGLTKDEMIDEAIADPEGFARAVYDLLWEDVR